MAFGNADDHIRNLEKQIEFRDRQISKLTLKCSLMQIDLENATDETTQKPRKKPKTERSTSKQRDRKKPRKEVIEKIKEPSIESTSSSVSLEEEEQKEEEEKEQKSPSIEQEEIEKIEPKPQQKQFSALELIKLFDDNEIGDQSINDMNLLSSLFIELKRLNQVSFQNVFIKITVKYGILL